MSILLLYVIQYDIDMLVYRLSDDIVCKCKCTKYSLKQWSVKMTIKF